MRFAFSAPSILAALEDLFNPDLLISRLSEDHELARLFAADAGVWEKYTIREHTLMVLDIFERFQASHVSESERRFFRLFLALHDIGKSLAIEQTGEKSNQAQFTGPILAAVLKYCEFEERWVRLVVELEHHDLLGQYLKDQVSLDEAVDQLEDIADITGFSSKEVLQYLTIFYQSDAGAYTETAGGKYSLDYLFEFDETTHQMLFSKHMHSNAHFKTKSPSSKMNELTKFWA